MVYHITYIILYYIYTQQPRTAAFGALCWVLEMKNTNTGEVLHLSMDRPTRSKLAISSLTMQ